VRGEERSPAEIERVDVRAVTKRYGATMALRGVSARFEPGHVNVIVGPNGSGKSTLLGIIATTVRPTAGQVIYSPLGEGSAEVRRRTGLLSHETLAYADLTGRQNVELAAATHGVDPAVAWPMVQERFELGAFADRALRTNSRGQKQRIALARALVHAPSLVLLDEPTTGLDERGTERLLRVIREEVQLGRVVVVVTHEPRALSGLDVKEWRLERGWAAPS
jgi:heme exporter protein A